MGNQITIKTAAWLSHDVTQDDWTRAFILWIAEYQSKHTQQLYFRAWDDFHRDMGNIHFGSVTHEHIRIWKLKLTKELEPSSVNLKLSAISSFYKYINQNYAYLREDNPSERVKQLRVHPYGKATLLVDNQDVELLGSIDRTTFEGLRDYTIILMFLTTGVRLAAIADATLESIRRQGALTFFGYVGKRGKAQQKRLPTNTARVLSEYMQQRGDSFGSLFWMKRYRIQYMIVKRCDAAFGEGHGITVHSLRHTAANNASKNGSIQDVRSLLDHESTRVTAVYLDHVTNDQGEKMSELLDKRYTD